jgi:hypothetical protein
LILSLVAGFGSTLLIKLRRNEVRSLSEREAQHASMEKELEEHVVVQA